MSESPSILWNEIEQHQGQAKRLLAFTTRVFLGVLILCGLLFPVYCATFHVGDYGPRATDNSAAVSEIAAFLGGIGFLLIALLQGKVWYHTASAVTRVRRVREIEHADPDTRESERTYAEQVMKEVHQNLLPGSIGWFALAAFVLVRVISPLFFAESPPP